MSYKCKHRYQRTYLRAKTVSVPARRHHINVVLGIDNQLPRLSAIFHQLSEVPLAASLNEVHCMKFKLRKATLM